MLSSRVVLEEAAVSVCLSHYLFFSCFDELKAKQERATVGDSLATLGAPTSCWELPVAKQYAVRQRQPRSANVLLIYQYKIRI